MDISFCVPIYNVSLYLSACLNSLLLVKNIDYEIICVDDCSTDNSLEIALEYEKKYSNIRVIKNTVNMGVSYSRNVAIKNAQGKYVWFVDADDCICHEIVDRFYEISTKEDADAVLGQYKKVENDYKYEIDDLRNKVINYQIVQDKNSKYCYSGSTCFRGIYKRSIFIDNDVFFCEKMKYAEDTLMVFAFANYAGVIVQTDAISYLYRQNYNSAMHTKTLKQNIARYQSYYTFYRELEKMINNGIKDIFDAKIKQQSLRQTIVLTLAKVQDKKFIKKELKKLKKEKIYPYSFNKNVFKGKGSFFTQLIIFLLQIKPFFWILHYLYTHKQKDTSK